MVRRCRFALTSPDRIRYTPMIWVLSVGGSTRSVVLLRWWLWGGFGDCSPMMVRSSRSSGLRVVVIGIMLVGSVTVAGCGRSSSSSAAGSASAGASAVPGAACQHVNSVAFDKTKFVLHAGLAFGAFHHFIYAPYKAGTLHGVATLGKAGLAALFTVHELKLAKADAESSPTLCHLAGPFDKATTAISGSTSQIKSGKASAQDIEGLNNDIDAVQHGAAADGVPAPDQVPATRSWPPAQGDHRRLPTASVLTVTGRS